VQAEENKEQ
jgi:replicative superfamily II helicase